MTLLGDVLGTPKVNVNRITLVLNMLSGTQQSLGVIATKLCATRKRKEKKKSFIPFDVPMKASVQT